MANSNLNIIVENKIPFIEGHLEKFGHVSYLDNADITPCTVADADALFVRTRTRCNRDLLEHSRVKFVATATIGLDHIDQEWCASQGIFTTNAPGCNAPAVAQYVFATLARVINRPITGYVLGIVGVGHVGRIVEQWARCMGIKVMLCDPPRSCAEGGDCWSTLDEIAEKADIVTFHTPLTRKGPDATYHLAGRDFFAKLRRAPIIVNAARGAVVDTLALIEARDAGLTGPLIIDTWEGEPGISTELLNRAAIATPHIAGYSLRGKERASQMVVDSFTRYFGLPDVQVTPDPIPPVPTTVKFTDIIASYDPTADDAALRAAPGNLEVLRDTYQLRPEPRQGSED